MDLLCRRHRELLRRTAVRHCGCFHHQDNVDGRKPLHVDVHILRPSIRTEGTLTPTVMSPAGDVSAAVSVESYHNSVTVHGWPFVCGDSGESCFQDHALILSQHVPILHPQTFAGHLGPRELQVTALCVVLVGAAVEDWRVWAYSVGISASSLIITASWHLLNASILCCASDNFFLKLMP